MFGNGNFYEGYWKDDQCHGYGRSFYVEGLMYHGEWLNDKVHGIGY